MQSKKISIIIPVYNVESYLQQCVESVISQTYSNLEIILVDDGSPDNCPALCDEWAKKDNRIKVIHKKNEGLSAARNSAIKVASGEYLLFIDSDDYVSNELCEIAIRSMENFCADVIVFGYEKFFENSSETEIIKPDEIKTLSKEDSLRKLITGDIDNYAWNKLYKKYLFDDIGYPEGFVWEDIGTTYKVFEKSEKIVLIDDVLYFYRQRKTSITGNVTVKALQDIFLLRFKRYNDLKAEFDDIAELAFSELAESAFMLYDRSLKEQADKEVMELTFAFIYGNKTEILNKSSGKMIELFYNRNKIYNYIIKMRQRAGKLLKLFKK